MPLFALLLTAAAPGGPIWYRISAADGTAIGYASEERQELPSGGRARISDRQMSLADGTTGATIVSSHTIVEDDPGGRTVAVRVQERTGRSSRRVEATILPGRADITIRTAAGTRTAMVALPAGVRFDGGEALLREGLRPTPGKPLEFDDFNASALAVDHVVLEASGDAAADGSMTLIRRRYDQGQLRGFARLRIGRDGAIVESVQPSFGSAVTMRVAGREAALAPHLPYAALRNAFIKSPVRIVGGALKAHIRYSFSFREGMGFAAPETGEQQTEARPGGMRIDICGDCGPGLPTDAVYLADALKPTAWLQSDAPQIRAIAAPVAHLKGTSDARKMELLREKARPYLLVADFAGHYSALETLSRRAGDCTEAAVLLAALGRAAGIPTRVVNGLVYSRYEYHGVSNAFLPHSWTLAYVDGRWRSFDLALDAFDSTHIALTVGDGDERSIAAAGQLAGLLQWDSVAEIRSAPDA